MKHLKSFKGTNLREWQIFRLCVPLMGTFGSLYTESIWNFVL